MREALSAEDRESLASHPRWWLARVAIMIGGIAIIVGVLLPWLHVESFWTALCRDPSNQGIHPVSELTGDPRGLFVFGRTHVAGLIAGLVGLAVLFGGLRALRKPYSRPRLWAQSLMIAGGLVAVLLPILVFVNRTSIAEGAVIDAVLDKGETSGQYHCGFPEFLLGTPADALRSPEAIEEIDEEMQVYDAALGAGLFVTAVGGLLTAFGGVTLSRRR